MRKHLDKSNPDRSPWWPGRPPPWVTLTTAPGRWTVTRLTMSGHRGGRAWGVCYAVEFYRPQHVTCCRPYRMMLTADAAFYVYGDGRDGCRAAKLIARRLAHDPAAVDRLPLGIVDPGNGRARPRRALWVKYHRACRLPCGRSAGGQ